MSYNINNSNLLYYYPFDTDYLDYKTGTGVSDLLSNASTSISTTTTKLSSGSLLMPGSIASTIQTPNTTFTTNGVTFAVWMKFNATPGFTTRIFDFGSGPNANNIGLWFANTTGLLQIVIWNPTIGTNGNHATGYVLPDFNWHHYCITFTTAGVTQLYVDGVAQSVTATLYPSLSTLTVCYLGRSNWASDVSAYGNINAYANQFVVFNRAITTTEISYLANYPSLVKFSSDATGFIQPCFLQGSKILRFSPETYQDEYVPVESLRKGDLISTAESGYQPIHSIGYKTIDLPKTDPNPSNRLYKFSQKTCPTVFEPLYITGEHCTLHRKIPEDKRDLITEHMGDVYITEEYYRVPAVLDDRAEPYDGEDEPMTIWHFALEHENVAHNYGVWANGLLVESCAVESLMERSGMRLLE